ncbi:MAG: hypothetical protein ACM31O_14450 [Bacteroidota bacterium]
MTDKLEAAKAHLGTKYLCHPVNRVQPKAPAFAEPTNPLAAKFKAMLASSVTPLRRRA